MASALREVLAAFGIEVDKEGNLDRADKHIDSFTEKLLDVGKGVITAFAAERVFEFGKELLEQADVLAKQSTALGISTAQLQGWQHAAQLSGSSAEGFTGAFTKFNKALAGARDGTGPAAEALKVFGVTADDVKKKTPIELLDQIADGFGAVTDTTKRTAATMALFGKSGNELAPLLAEGSEGIKKLRAEVGELGASFDDAFLENAQEFNDNVDRLKLGIRGLATQIIGPILPGLVRLTSGAIAATKGFVQWIKQTTFIRVTLEALSIKGVLGLAGALPKLIARFGGLTAILGRAALFAARFIAPLLLLDDVIGFFEGDDSVIGSFIDKAFGPGAQDKVRDFFGLLKSEPDKARAEFQKYADSTEWGKDSFMRGWNEGLLEEGLFITNALTGGWDNFVAKAKVAGMGLMLALKIVWTEIKFAGLGVAAAILDAFDATWNGIVSGAQAALNAMIDVLSKLPGTADAVKDLREKVKSFDSARGSGDAGEFVSKQRDKARLDIAAEGDKIGALATAEVPHGIRTTGDDNSQTTIAPETHIHVTVEGGGTDADLGNRVGKAGAKAAAPINLKAAKAALVPTPGG